jgi:hypothetical protein
VPSSDRITIPSVLAALLAEDEPESPASEVRATLPRYAVPWLVVTYDALRALPIEPRDAFLVSLVDGRSSVDMILDLSAMPQDETLAILTRLLKLGAIELHDPD